MMRLHVAAGLLLAALFVGFAASRTLLGPRGGWPAVGNASVVLHRLLCAILKVRVKRFGAPGPGKRLVAANHVSWLDVLVLGATERNQRRHLTCFEKGPASYSAILPPPLRNSAHSAQGQLARRSRKL